MINSIRDKISIVYNLVEWLEVFTDESEHSSFLAMSDLPDAIYDYNIQQFTSDTKIWQPFNFEWIDISVMEEYGFSTQLQGTIRKFCFILDAFALKVNPLYDLKDYHIIIKESKEWNQLQSISEILKQELKHYIDTIFKI